MSTPTNTNTPVPTSGENNPPTNTPTNVSPTAQTGTSAQASRNQQRNHNNNNCPIAVDTTNKDFQGKEPSIGAVMGLRIEKINKKVTYDICRDNLANHIGSKIENGDIIVRLVTEYEHPEVNYEAENKPKALPGTDVDDKIEKAIQAEKVKLYVKELRQIKSNIKKVFSLIWG